MVWKILDRIATLTYILLSVILITILMNNSSENAGVNNFAQKLTMVQQEITKVITNNTDYLEQRLNKISERQDNYQVTIDQRIYVLELRMKELQADKKQNQKIIQNNINNNLNNSSLQ